MMCDKDLILAYKARYAENVSNCFFKSKKYDFPTYRQIFSWHLVNHGVLPLHIDQAMHLDKESGYGFRYMTIPYSISTIDNRLATEKNFAEIFKKALAYTVEFSYNKRLIYTNETGFESEVSCIISHVGSNYTLYNVEGEERVIRNSKIIDII